MGLTTRQHNRRPLGNRCGNRLLQVLGQAARVASTRAHRWPQPVGKPVRHGAKVHFWQRLLAQRTQFRRVGPELLWVLLRAPYRHMQHPRHLSESQGIREHLGAVKNGGHQVGLVIHQHQLGICGIQQHGNLSSVQTTEGRFSQVVAATASTTEHTTPPRCRRPR